MIKNNSSGVGEGNGEKNGSKRLGIDRGSKGNTNGLERNCEVDLSTESLASSEASMFLENPIWLSTKEAAIYLRKFRKIDGKPSEGAVRTAIWRGDLKARKWRRRLYFRRIDLDRLLQNSPSIDRRSAWA